MYTSKVRFPLSSFLWSPSPQSMSQVSSPLSMILGLRASSTLPTRSISACLPLPSARTDTPDRRSMAPGRRQGSYGRYGASKLALHMGCVGMQTYQAFICYVLASLWSCGVLPRRRIRVFWSFDYGARPARVRCVGRTRTAALMNDFDERTNDIRTYLRGNMRTCKPRLWMQRIRSATLRIAIPRDLR